MYKLSFDDNVKDARPIAYVAGGEHNDSILSLVEEKHNNKKDVDKNEIIILIGLLLVRYQISPYRYPCDMPPK